MGKILVADNDPNIRDEIAEFLEPDGHEVIHARDGAEAIKLVAEHVPNVAIVDLRMPLVDGMGVLDKIKSRPETSGIPVIVLTEKGTPREKDTAIHLGALDYITKPWLPGELETRVNWALRSSTSVPAVPWQLSDIEAQTKDGESGIGRKSVPKPSGKRQANDDPEEGSDVDSGSTSVSAKKGGIVQSPGGEVQVQIPPNAVPVDMAVKAQKATSNAPAPSTLRVGLGKTTADVRFVDKTGQDVQGVNLKQPARIGIRYSDADVHDAGSEANLRVKQFNNGTGQWEELPTDVDRKSRRAFVAKQKFPPSVIRPEGTVMLVEEREREAEILTAALEGAGYDVLYETHPDLVVKRILDERPGILLLGLSMKREDGFRVLRQVKNDPEASLIPVITVAPNGQEDTYRGSIALGARDVITTPENMGDVQSRVARAYASARIRMIRARRAKKEAALRRGANKTATRTGGRPAGGRKRIAAPAPGRRRVRAAAPAGARRARPATAKTAAKRTKRVVRRVRRLA